MSGFEQIAVGLIFVGTLLTLKVVMDGLQQLQLIRDQISEIQTSRAECEVKAMEEAEKIQEVGQTLEELKTVVADLEKTRGQLDIKIQDMKEKAEKNSKNKNRSDPSP